MSHQKFLTEARIIAQQAAQLLLSRYDNINEMDFKGEINPVTQMDRLCEKFITDSLHKAFKDHGIVAEEGTLVESKGSYTWYVDPLDGTTNYAHQFPVFATSMALVEQGRPVVGVISAPKLDEHYYAMRGGGAFRNDQPIRVSRVAQLGKAFLATGVPYTVRENIDFHMGLMKRFIEKSLAVRRAGSACVDLAGVAVGRFEGYWESGLQPWDAAAGILLVEEAGGKVSDANGEPYIVGKSTSVVASNGLIHPGMVEITSSAGVARA